MRRMTSWTKPFLPEPESYSLIPPSPHSPATRAGGHASGERELQGSCHASQSIGACGAAHADPVARAGIRRRACARLQPSCVSCALVADGARRARRGLACSARARALHPDSPRPADPTAKELRREVPSTSTTGARKRAEHREISQLSAFGESIRRTPSVKQRGAAARGASHRNPRRSRASLPARRSPAAHARAARAGERARSRCAAGTRALAFRVAHPLPPRDAILPGSCRNFDACVGGPPTPATDSEDPAELCGTPGIPGNAASLFWAIRTPAGVRAQGGVASGARARSRARRPARRSGTARRRGPRLRAHAAEGDLRDVAEQVDRRVVSSSSPVAGSLRTRSFS